MRARRRQSLQERIEVRRPYSGHAHRASLEVYSRLALTDAQHAYDQVIDRFPVWRIMGRCPSDTITPTTATITAGTR